MFTIISKSIHRMRLEDMIKLVSHMVKGRVLDIGSKNRRYDRWFPNATSIVAIDISPQRDDIIKGDSKILPFKDNSFDTIVSLETFEYILETDEALREISRALKNGGLFIFSIPFLNPVHGGRIDSIDIQIKNNGTDLVRYTAKGLYFILSKFFNNIEIKSFGSRWSIIADFIFEIVRNRRILRYILLPLYWMVWESSKMLERIDNDKRYIMGYVVLCRKDFVKERERE